MIDQAMHHHAMPAVDRKKRVGKKGPQSKVRVPYCQSPNDSLSPSQNSHHTGICSSIRLTSAAVCCLDACNEAAGHGRRWSVDQGGGPEAARGRGAGGRLKLLKNCLNKLNGGQDGVWPSRLCTFTHMIKHHRPIAADARLGFRL